MNFVVSDASFRALNIKYLSDTLFEIIETFKGKSKIENGEDRCEFLVEIPKECANVFRISLEDKIADVIAVNYKYEFFKKHIRVTGLNSVEYELLLSALISADIEEDKRYSISKLSKSPYSIDGSFNFLMKPLLTKWTEIVSFIPSYFKSEQLKDFISYVVAEKKNKKTFVIDGMVFDRNYNKLTRADLVLGGEARVVKEILLSSSCEVELNSKIPELDEFYLKEFFGDKIFFKKGYFC